VSVALTESRKARALSRDAIGVAAQALASVRAAIAAATPRARGDGAVSDLRRREERALATLAAAKRKEANARTRIEEELAEARRAPLEQFAKLDAEIPVAFFPVRIETRFRRIESSPEGAAAANELLVRIYPDSVLADEHEPLLTAAEVEAGRDYWRRAWREGSERDAWTLLLKAAIAPRAAWIVVQTAPQNSAERPASGENPAPLFANVAIRADGWHRAPEARGLPERWIVTTYRNGQAVHQALSEPVREGLALTIRLYGEDAPDEEAELVDLTGDGLTVEAPVRWAYDFDEALAAGMAVRLAMSDEDMRLGFSHVLVMGVRTSEAPEAQSTEIAALMTAQNAMRGVAFVPQGAKTNNTSENPSDYPPEDVAGAISFTTYREPTLVGADRDGARFMGALGLEPETAAHFWGADRDEQSNARAMLDALWPATLGYFLRQMMTPDVTDALAQELRAWASAHLRARGPYPAFRVGPAPYGLLPVGPLFQWPERMHGEGVERVLPGALQRLARIWIAAADGAPRVGRSTDADADLVGALAMDASAQGAQVRRAIGYEAAWNIWKFHGLNLTPLEQSRGAIASGLVQALGAPTWDPRVLYLNFADKAYDFSGPLIEDPPLSESERLAFNYISWLRTADIADLKEQKALPANWPVNALLYLMLRHALLSEIDSAAKHVLAWRGLLLDGEMREAELINIAGQGDAPRRTAWDRFGMTIPGVTGTRTLGEVIADPRPAPSAPPQLQQAQSNVAALRVALQTLENLPTAELHRLFGETIDISSHRLDAWLIGLFNARLKQMRANRPKGLYIGCFGWVEELRPDPPGEVVSVTASDGRRAEARTDTGGYVLAPSMLQAAAAAVLRSAYLSRSGPAREAYTMDLSSRRVRTALWLVDTVRDDQPLGAALGYQFERGLHERHPGVELDKFIDELRGLYALAANKAEDSGEPAESVAARNVVDGLRLHAAWREKTIPFGSGGLTPNNAERVAIDAELELLDDAVDAVSDLMTAEAVYQVIKGSAGAAAATLDSLAKGARPPEIEVAATPRSGAVLHQRCVIALGDGALTPDWSTIALTPRAAAAPELNAWLARQFGPPGAIACAATPEGTAPRDVTVADLGLQAIDLFHLARAAETSEGVSEFDARIAWFVAAAAGPDVSLSIDYDAAAAPDAVTFAQAFEIASAIGRVLGFSRPLMPRDLLPPEMEKRADEADSMAAELKARAEAARDELEAAITDLSNALSAANPDLGVIRAALARAARFGVGGAFPTSRHATDAQAPLTRLAETVCATLAARRDAAAAATSASDRLQAIFGRAFTVIARFRPAAPELLAQALSAEPDLGGDGDTVVESWIAGLARVREPISAWRRLVLYERVFGRMSERARIVQLPLETNPAPARWAGLDYGAERPRAGLVSLAIDGGPPPQAGEPWAGLMLDAWPELMPNVEEDAGVAFHYDAPGAQAPQAVLLAVSPPGQKNWSFALFEQTLFHAFDLAKMRAVDLRNLGDYGQLTPMSFLTANPANSAISTTFAGLTAADAMIATRET
jgi:hypothetical protein